VAVFAAQLIIAAIGDHAQHPGFEGAAAKTAQVPVSGNERSLGGISSFVFITHHSEGNVESQVLIRNDQAVESIHFAEKGGFDQGGFVHASPQQVLYLKFWFLLPNSASAEKSRAITLTLIA